MRTILHFVGDLKPALARQLNAILEPVRKHFETNPEAKALLTQIKVAPSRCVCVDPICRNTKSPSKGRRSFSKDIFKSARFKLKRLIVIRVDKLEWGPKMHHARIVTSYRLRQHPS